MKTRMMTQPVKAATILVKKSQFLKRGFNSVKTVAHTITVAIVPMKESNWHDIQMGTITQNMDAMPKATPPTAVMTRVPAVVRNFLIMYGDICTTGCA
jgi:hypothetical protein